MKTWPVIMGIVVILALVSAPGAAMMSKDDYLNSIFPPNPPMTYPSPAAGGNSPDPAYIDPYPPSWVIPEPGPVEPEAAAEARTGPYLPDGVPDMGGSYGDPNVTPIPPIPKWAMAALPFEPFDRGDMFHWQDGGTWYVDPPDDDLYNYTDDLPRECGGSMKRSVEELIASFIPSGYGMNPDTISNRTFTCAPAGLTASLGRDDVHEFVDGPFTCASCENWTAPPGAEPHFMPTPTPIIPETSETISFSNTTSIGYYPKIAKNLYNQSEEAVEQYQQGLLHHSLYPVPGWVGNLTDYNERVKSLIIRSFEAS